MVKTRVFAARFLTVACLLIFFALGLHTALSKSLTVDEPIHILRGRTLWETGQVWLQYEHAPLSHWLNGLLLFTEPTLPHVTELPDWLAGRDPVTLSKQLLWPEGNTVHLDRTVLLARLPILFTGLFLGAALARWAKMSAGWLSQSVAIVLFAFSPNLLASFALATTDAPLTAVYLGAVLALWLYWRSPSWERWLLAAATLGLAISAKVTALLLLPLTLVLCYSSRQRDQPWWRPGLVWLSLLPVAGLVLWALYGFEWRSMAGLPFTVPAATYGDSVIDVLTHVGKGHESFLLGERSTGGWWHYFAVAFALKTPLPTLLLLGIALFSLSRWRRWRETIYLWLPAVAFFALASVSRLNIGYRHILPVLPFVLLLTAGAMSLWQQGRRTSLLLALLLLWYGFGSLRQHPHYLAYFNELAGGPAKGYHYLGNSNLDWGQDLKLLADYVNSHDEPVYFSYYGPYASDPAYYGLEKPPLFTEQGVPVNYAPANPAPGQYALSATHLQGMFLPDFDLFDWFSRRSPVDSLGYSILIYEVPQAADGAWIGYCLDPAPLLVPAAAAQLVGQDGLRNVYFNCDNSWVFPSFGQAGWYILPQRGAWPIGRLFPEHLELVYRHSPSAVAPAYEVYYWDGQVDPATVLATAPGDVTLADGNPVALPLPVGNTAMLIGYRLHNAEWWTVWQVQSRTAEALSVAGHLYQDGQAPTVIDGLGYTSEQWQPGDLVVQFHSFDSVASSGYLATGLYNYLTGEPLTFIADGRVDAFVHLFPSQDD